MEKETLYEPPLIEILLIEVEKGFAASRGTEGYDDNDDDIII